MIELTIFDCDGVLVDSEILGCRIEVELLVDAGYPIQLTDFIERFSGMSWKEILGIIDSESGLGLSATLVDRTEALLDERLARDVTAIAGVAEALQALPYSRCVCSNTKLDRVEAMLAKVRLDQYFLPNVYSAKDLGEGRSKPKPDIFLHGAARMGVPADRTVVIEDSVHGVMAAKAAGMRVIGFIGGGHTYPRHAEKLLGVGADAIISRMADLPEAIGRL